MRSLNVFIFIQLCILVLVDDSSLASSEKDCNYKLKHGKTSLKKDNRLYFQCRTGYKLIGFQNVPCSMLKDLKERKGIIPKCVPKKNEEAKSGNGGRRKRKFPKKVPKDEPQGDYNPDNYDDYDESNYDDYEDYGNYDDENYDEDYDKETDYDEKVSTQTDEASTTSKPRDDYGDYYDYDYSKFRDKDEEDYKEGSTTILSSTDNTPTTTVIVMEIETTTVSSTSLSPTTTTSTTTTDSTTTESSTSPSPATTTTTLSTTTTKSTTTTSTTTTKSYSDYEYGSGRGFITDDEDFDLGSGDNNGLYNSEDLFPLISTSTTTKILTTATTRTTTASTTTTIATLTTSEVPPVFKSLNNIFITDDEDLIDGSGFDLDYETSGSGYYVHEIEDIGNSSGEKKEQKARVQFYEKYEVDLLRLDASCIIQFTEAHPITHATIRRYDHRVPNPALPGEFYAEVLYKCDEGYAFDPSKPDTLFCSERRWIGKRPLCVAKSTLEIADPSRPSCDPDVQEKKRCEHICYLDKGVTPTCECHDGFFLNDDGECEDVDECVDDPELCDHICTNKPGTYMCDCRLGFTSQGTACVDINECLLNNGHGPCQDECKNVDGGYQCECGGLPGTQLSDKDNHTCISDEACQVNNGGCSHECIHSYNQIFCLCPDGYELDEDWKTCVDINECVTGDIQCLNKCMNVPGSAYCKCDSGYEGDDCSDINECETQDLICDHNCINTEGSAHCTCKAGFDLMDETECFDKDECEMDNGGCEQVCNNLEGTFQCGCKPGFHLNTDNLTCTDENECTIGIANCGIYGDCINTPGSFYCECHPGFELMEDSCMDINECTNSTLCGSGSCNNLEGTYECKCDSGYIFHNSTCLDINECIRNPCGHGECINESPGYSCSCHSGYVDVDNVCRDYDECLHDNPCGVGGKCNNKPGSFDCDCAPGYEFKNGYCHDINECSLEKDPCGPHGDCVNNDGSFECVCHQGFIHDQNDSNICIDFDECLSSPCFHSECKNTLGGFECLCETGFALSEILPNTCEDINECALNNGDCSQVCVNILGSHYCRCYEGYKKDERGNCFLKDECRLSRRPNGGCQQLCINIPGGLKCECNPGYIVDSQDPRLCVDKNECTINNGGCQHACINKLGGHTCSCHLGFKPDEKNPEKCVKAKACSVNNGGCSHICKSTESGLHHRCMCPSGFKLKTDARTCKPIGGICSSAPRPSNGYYRCNKKKVSGYFVKGTKCKLKCRKGFMPTGHITRKCINNGTWTGDEDHACEVMNCPPLPPLHNGNISPETCMTDSSPRGSKCLFTCNNGYQITGVKKTRCTRLSEWKRIRVNPPKCNPTFNRPQIHCPPDMIEPLPRDSKSVYVFIPKPRTNVNWERYVDSDPVWAVHLEGEMIRGKHVVTFRARSPVNPKESATCQMLIHVKDVIPPTVQNCPKSFIDYLSPGQVMKRISWNEPNFKDNIKIQHVMASFLPGHYFSEGAHKIVYHASDMDGNHGRCEFTITLKRLDSQSSENPFLVFVPKNGHKVSSSEEGLSYYNYHKLPSDHGLFKCDKVPSLENGKFNCKNLGPGQEGIKCIPECDSGYQFYQKFSSRPPSYICNAQRVDWELKRFIPDCSPVHKSQLKSNCDAGWEYRSDEGICVACPPGMYRDSNISVLCQLCPKSYYSSKFASNTCNQCQRSYTTKGLGSRGYRHCYPNRSSFESRRGRKEYLLNKKRNKEKTGGLRFYKSWMSPPSKLK
ncbi:FBN1 [Lepeophtheirus salmonis]|uniref:FBN1 n=1 Tax=Lepeophtheirus salmonis TaxID=72036 RepID=A0A7R8D5N8_LEPSM|nr:FBN1 [Lepeophtheirus salmonis]CAF3036039.1 FBN1 [Lepeophtheirus salmonis]